MRGREEGREEGKGRQNTKILRVLPKREKVDKRRDGG